MFSDRFVWGAAASSYQIEGAAETEGKGPSIWDEFCRQPGVIRRGESGAVAADHYHRFREDVALMSEIGIRAYRGSVSWPRVMPAGTGEVNAAGLDFYDALVDALLERQIEPWLTLYHWDLPLALQEAGGWLNPQMPNWFADYTRAVVARVGDRVRHWMTINEPQVFLQFGLGDGTHAPGLKLPVADRLQAAHHVLLAHGRSVQAIRELSPAPCVVGWAPVGVTKIPHSPNDVEAARNVVMGVDPQTVWNNVWFNDPIFFGHYPEAGLEAYGANAPQFSASDMETIAQPIDFLGLNIYFAELIDSGVDGQPPQEAPFSEGWPRTAMDWPVTPEALYWGPRYFWDRYQSPIVITENGISNNDWVMADGRVDDPQRIDYTTRYLRELRRAASEGIDVRGYFHWSLMDNFE
ncbi:MAG: family 1 glycosylhydrolase, partial [Planctomycetales bacterium]|nr:family 1 glycosylhydrolase [Planctomycetales bacterium]